MIHELAEHYQIQVNELSKLGGYVSFWIRNKVYVLVPVDHFEEEELVEMKQLSDFLLEQGDISVASFVPNINGYYVSEMQNKNYCLLKSVRTTERYGTSDAKELALFHRRGRLFPSTISKLSRIGEWKALWEKRLDQMEKFWQTRLANHPVTPFDQLFIDSFPYYLGLAENAIQYVVDTELDDEPQPGDAATVCQQRFTPQTWSLTKRCKIPTEWVFDHASRDLAEWIRATYAEGGDKAEEKIMQFLYDYETEESLSSFSWRLLFARLLFPLHYFEAIESYYLTNNEEQQRIYKDRLEIILADTKKTERFLGDFYTMIRLPTQKLGIREIDWLQM